jgi:hypothetical protein
MLIHYGVFGQPDRISYIKAKSGLLLRSEPNQNSKPITLIPFMSEIKIIKISSNLVAIDNITDNCVNIEYNDTNGWVFQGYLTSDKDYDLKIKRNNYKYDIEKLFGINENDPNLYRTIINTYGKPLKLLKNTEYGYDENSSIIGTNYYLAYSDTEFNIMRFSMTNQDMLVRFSTKKKLNEKFSININSPISNVTNYFGYQLITNRQSEIFYELGESGFELIGFKFSNNLLSEIIIENIID